MIECSYFLPFRLTEKRLMRVRTVDRDVTSRTVLVFPAVSCLTVKARHFYPKVPIRNTAVTFEAKLSDRTAFQQLWVCRTVRRVARSATLDFQRSMFKNKRTLFVRMAANT